MPMPAVHYRVVGQDDYMLEIIIEFDGAYRIDSGDHTSHKPRGGRLDAEQIRMLTALSERLGPSRDHPGPEGATGFVAELMVGEAENARHYRVWEGALPEEPDLMAFIRALEVI